MDLRLMLLVVAALCFIAPTIVSAHGGGLDRYGCHHNRKAGGYHCHRGPLAGEHFNSKEAMLQRLQQIDSPRQKSPSSK